MTKTKMFAITAALAFMTGLASAADGAKPAAKAVKPEPTANLKDWKARKKFLVCQTCGHTTRDLTIKVCPVCSQPREQFTEIE